MATLDAIADRFTGAERPVGNILDESVILAQLIAATRFYSGYASLATPSAISSETVITDSEWALIRPLFLLYIERETALQLEASRGLGTEPFGRSSSEVAADIAQAEAGLPSLAFSQPIVSL